MDANDTTALSELTRVARTFPAIDNHAHPLLAEAHRDKFPFEGLISEATDEALTSDAIHTLACFRAALQLGDLLNIKGEPSWEAVKEKRTKISYEELCRTCMQASYIQCILLDDGLGGVTELAEGYKWHDRFTSSPSKRIVRVEVLAEDLLKDIIVPKSNKQDALHEVVYSQFCGSLSGALSAAASDAEVVGFKSIACYRTGLDITVKPKTVDIIEGLRDVISVYVDTGKLRLQSKPVNDFIVVSTLEISAQCGKPVQFHTGLGDNDITLALSSPSHLQPVIKAYPKTKFVLLHSSYPYTRDAGYLTAVYPNVFLDFGEIFPFLSADGQIGVIKQVLELCPTNKIMWSTDGHWWPESYYLGSMQAREALLAVLSGSVHRRELTEAQAIQIVKNALFYNANRIYSLGLRPQLKDEEGDMSE